MKLTDSDVLELASSERIKLDPAEVPQLRDDLNGILEFASVLRELPENPSTETAETTEASTANVNVLRADIVLPSLDQAQALALAPEAEDGFFRVPRTVESEGA